MATTTCVKFCTLKRLFPAISYKEKMFLGRTTLLWIIVFSYESLLIISLKVFVHLLVSAAVCYFSVYKFIGWDPGNIYLFKVNSRTQEKGVNYVLSQQLKE